MTEKLKKIFKRNKEDGWTANDLVIELFEIPKEDEKFKSKRVSVRRVLKILVEGGYIFEDNSPRGDVWYHAEKVYKLKK